MISRPAFLNRLPDLQRMRGQIIGFTGLLTGAFALLFVLAASELDARRSREVAHARAEAIARGAAVWLDGDAHAGLGQDPAKRLGDLGASLEQLALANGLERGIRTLRPKESARPALNAQPRTRHAGALEVVIPRSGSGPPAVVDYQPEMGPAFVEGKPASTVGPGGIRAYAPILDSWGSATAIVDVRTSAQGALWRRIAFLLAALLFAGVPVVLAVFLARIYARSLGSRLDELLAGAGGLARGDWSRPIALGRAPRELAALGAALENLRARLEAHALGQPLPPVEATEPPREMRSAPPTLGDPVEFDLALLTQQIAEPARKYALGRRLDFQLVFPDGVPSRLQGHPVVLYQVLDTLVRNAFRATEKGGVSLRVSRAGEGQEGWRLRFEVSDTGPGIPFKDQQELTETLAQAAQKDPAEIREPLPLASALAHALGGELGFESQPGQGSRFGFTASFQGPRADAATGFRPRRALRAR